MDISATPVFETDVDLKPFNTLHLPAKAASFLSIKSKGQLIELLKRNALGDAPVFILGGGSNVLFATDFEGLVLKMDIKGREIVKETEDSVWLKTGAGENWHETVLFCVEQGWGGIENLSLIPGTMGAAPIQNIGAYGVELQDVFDSLHAIELKSGRERTFNRDECRFGYRDSVFKHMYKGEYVITDVTLKLSRHPVPVTTYGAIREKLRKKGIDEPSIKDISDIVIAIRNSKLPNPDDLGNAGSFFKNPVVNRQTYQRLKHKYPQAPGYELNEIEVKVPAGWLIEQAGWKGRTIGHAGTYEQQALVIVNHGDAMGSEILELAEKIKTDVNKKFGIALVPEVNIVGS